jgi:hypothetical protein
MPPDPSRNHALQDARRALNRAAPVVRYGLLLVGSAVVLDQIRPMVSDGQFTWGERRVAALVAAVTMVGFALAGWAAGWILKGAAELIGSVADGAEAAIRATYLMEAHLVPTLTRAAVALERLAASSPSDAATQAAEAVRRAIEEGRWTGAKKLLQDFARDHPQSPEAATLASELADARQAEADKLFVRLDAATLGEDPAEALDCRDKLTRHLSGEALRDLDLRVARWLAGWVRGRVRRGDIDADVADLAARGAERFSDTAEGRTLLAAVPDLRRRAGLCPGCARPYRGRADACPACLSASPAGGVQPKGSS